LRDKTKTSYQVEKDIEVIPNFIDTDKYNRMDNEHTRCLKEKFAPDGEKILIHISNFRPLKRVQDVIKIFAEVNKEVPSKLLLVGDGPDRSECERLARELDIYDRVKFMGKQDMLVEILSVSDLFVIPSQSESFGLSALEAMSCGVPVISTSIGGLPELNVHGETGYIAEIGDVERMSKYAIELLSNTKKYEYFSKKARERALKFREENIVPLYEEFYERVLAENKKEQVI
jgi:N-acetyl-alpha-D-glucosaminyl L-malate synthase BshA